MPKTIPQDLFRYQTYDPRLAEEAIFRHTAEFDNLIRSERLPDDAPVSMEERINIARSIPPFMEVLLFLAWQGEQLVGRASVAIANTPDNQHLAQVDLAVRPSHRRQGLGSELLRQALLHAQSQKRSLLIAQTHGRAPGGEPFLLRVGATKGLEAHMNQLALAELDQALLQRWQEQARQRASGFELLFWDGAYPEEHLTQMSKLWDLTNQQPLGDLQVEDFDYTPEMLRQIEDNIAQSGAKRWTIVARQRSDGAFAGYTEIVYHPTRPKVLNQGLTGVFPEYRNLGLGRWLKAAMLERILGDLPEAKVVRTGNADSNAPMLHINDEMGFKPYLSEALWQVDVAGALAALEPDGPAA